MPEFWRRTAQHCRRQARPVWRGHWGRLPCLLRQCQPAAPACPNLPWGPSHPDPHPNPRRRPPPPAPSPGQPTTGSQGPPLGAIAPPPATPRPLTALPRARPAGTGWSRRSVQDRPGQAQASGLDVCACVREESAAAAGLVGGEGQPVPATPLHVEMESPINELARLLPAPSPS